MILTAVNIVALAVSGEEHVSQFSWTGLRAAF